MKDAIIWYKVVTTTIGENLQVQQQEKQFKDPQAIEARRAAFRYAINYRDEILEAGAVDGRGIVVYMVFGGESYQIEGSKDKMSLSTLDNLALEYFMYMDLGYDTGNSEPLVLHIPEAGSYPVIWEHGKGIFDASIR